MCDLIVTCVGWGVVCCLGSYGMRRWSMICDVVVVFVVGIGMFCVGVGMGHVVVWFVGLGYWNVVGL